MVQPSATALSPEETSHDQKLHQTFPARHRLGLDHGERLPELRRPTTVGRPPSPSTSARSYERGLASKDLTAATDDMVRSIATKPEIRDSPYRVQIVMADVVNRTSMPARNFDIYLARIRALLNQTDSRYNIGFVTEKSRRAGSAAPRASIRRRFVVRLQGRLRAPGRVLRPAQPGIELLPADLPDCRSQRRRDLLGELVRSEVRLSGGVFLMHTLCRYLFAAGASIVLVGCSSPQIDTTRLTSTDIVKMTDEMTASFAGDEVIGERTEGSDEWVVSIDRVRNLSEHPIPMRERLGDDGPASVTPRPDGLRPSAQHCLGAPARSLATVRRRDIQPRHAPTADSLAPRDFYSDTISSLDMRTDSYLCVHADGSRHRAGHMGRLQ